MTEPEQKKKKTASGAEEEEDASDEVEGEINPLTGMRQASVTAAKVCAAGEDAGDELSSPGEREPRGLAEEWISEISVPRRTRAPLHELLLYMLIMGIVGSLAMRYYIYATMWGASRSAADGRKTYYCVWLIINHSIRAKFGEAACFASSEALYVFIKNFNTKHLSLALLQRYYLGTSCVYGEGYYMYLKRSIEDRWSSAQAWAETRTIVDARLQANAKTLIDVFRKGGNITLTISGAPVECARHAGVLTEDECSISFATDEGFRAENSQPVQMLLALVHARAYGVDHIFEDNALLRNGLALQLVNGAWQITSTTWYGLEVRWSQPVDGAVRPRESALIDALWARFADQATATQCAHAATNKLMAFSAQLAVQQRAREARGE